ncbi:MAG TPA: ComEC/Rec2 family competence protein [Candidatus Limnocylindrales bacterium]|nr:ComEC/Rec2 family competence protein [Candidatus Limnocylindrales bacterium]
MAGALAVGSGRSVALAAGGAALAGLAGTALLGTALLSRSTAPGLRSRPAWAGLAALSAGLLLIVVRSLLAGGPADLAGAPLGNLDKGRHEATVESVSAPKAAEQIALIQLEPGPGEAGGAALVEALLPRYPEIGSGDRIAVRGRIEAPGADDFGTYLRRIGAAGSLRSPTLELVAGPGGGLGLLDGIRQGSAAALVRSLPEPQAGLADGILIGLRDRVDRDLAAAFTTAGVSHIVAISGWNIAIVGAMVAAALGTRVGPRTRTVITIGAILAYTLVAGASPSVNRAAVMATIGLAARAAGRSSSAIAALGWAVVGLLAIDPGTVVDPGFALSGLATAGLIAWAGPLAARLQRVRGRALPAWLAESLAISLAAEAATLPVVLLTFGRLALIAPLTNLAIVPLVPPAMAAGTLALIAGWLGALGLPAALVTVLGLPAWAVLGLMVALVRLAASLPFASVVLPPPWNLGAAALVAAVVALVATGAGQTVRRSPLNAAVR